MLGLASSEGLGSTACGTRTELLLHGSHSASRCAPPQEQSRYSASAAPIKDFAWRCAPCSLDRQIGFAATFPCLRSGLPAWTDLLVESSVRANLPSRSVLLHPLAASGGFIMYLDWTALTPALTEIRLLALWIPLPLPVAAPR